MNSILNVLLTAGVISIIADAIITSVRAAAARKRELKGLLRMLYVEHSQEALFLVFIHELRRRRILGKSYTTLRISAPKEPSKRPETPPHGDYKACIKQLRV
jgi:hypothetical protein